MTEDKKITIDPFRFTDDMLQDEPMRPHDVERVDLKMVEVLYLTVGPVWLNRAMRGVFENIGPEQLCEVRENYRAEVDELGRQAEAETVFHELTEDLTREAYKAHARKFIAVATSTDSLKRQWIDERYLRGHCRIHEEDFEELKNLLDAKFKELGGKVVTEVNPFEPRYLELARALLVPNAPSWLCDHVACLLDSHLNCLGPDEKGEVLLGLRNACGWKT
jgi:hypothetical protein